MITKEQVEKFLEDFSLKVKIFGIRFRDDRQKNQNSLVELGITPHTICISFHKAEHSMSYPLKNEHNGQ